MNSSVLMLVCIGVLAGGYVLYGRFLSRLFGIDASRVTPAHRQRDGVDFVPARHWLILFGHHFSSICGAGPIVGPAIAVAYWGWGVSLVWILAGSLLMGAVADYASLVMSVRQNGDSIPEVARTAISPRARLLFAAFIWLSLILVIAVFAILAAKTFVSRPDIVVPSMGIIPLAVLIGWLMYARAWRLRSATALGLVGLALLLAYGGRLDVTLNADPALNLKFWIVLLLVYGYVASVSPVQYLLQPRDYLAGFVLFAAIGLGLLGVFVSRKPMDGAFFAGWTPDPALWPSAGPLWPMLFVTIACGAISGFHSLVSSGTTCKQLDNERHACRIGYGGMLTEGLVACLVVVCVSAGLSRAELAGFLRGASGGGPIAAFGSGFGALTSPLLGGWGGVFAVMALNAFILTTLDTATRIGRYLTQELFGIKNRHVATLAVVVVAGILALTGHWQKIWPVFGASNQLVAALALLVASCWLLAARRPTWPTLVPAILMLATTIGAFVLQIAAALRNVDLDGRPDPLVIVAAASAILVLLSVAVFIEAARTARRLRASRA